MSLLLVLLTGLLLTACQPSAGEKVYRETRFLFDTEVYIEAYGGASSEDVQQAGERAMEQIATLDQAANFYAADSEITMLNEAAGLETVALSEDTFALLERALEIAELTNGAFNPAVGPFVELWQTAKTDGVLPTEEEVALLLPLADYKKIELDAAQRTAFLQEEGMSVDLGAIAKGFAVERAVEILQEGGVESAIVRAGGNVYALGEKPDGTSWRVGIRNPFQLDETIKFVELHNQAVDTSAIYEQNFSINGKEYGHIIDPRTGYPAEGTASSTIITTSPSLADALSTAVFILGHEEGAALIETIPETESFIIEVGQGTRSLVPLFFS